MEVGQGPTEKKEIGFFQQLFCAHDYDLINQFEMKSEFEIVKECGEEPLFERRTRKHISDYKCSKCRKLFRLIETTY